MVQPACPVLFFFTPVNPTITFGGYEGGPKKEIYDQLPPQVYPKSIYIDSSVSFVEAASAMNKNGFIYPIAVKPSIGMMGLMFRKIDNNTELEIYHRTMTAEYILQELIHYPIEVSVFYYRFPGEQKGVITAFTKKEPLEVTGNGTSTLEELMLGFEGRPGFYAEEWKAKHRTRLKDIIPAGDVFKFSWVANLSRGARLISLKNEIDESLCKVFDELSHYSGKFYYGRYDIKCASVEDLKKGQRFSILEFNGAGAEPHHVYGNGNNLFKAFKIIVAHWEVLYKIARVNYKQGVEYWPFRKSMDFQKKHEYILESYGNWISRCRFFIKVNESRLHEEREEIMYLAEVVLLSCCCVF